MLSFHCHAVNCELFLKNYVPTMTDSPVKDAKYMEQLVRYVCEAWGRPTKG